MKYLGNLLLQNKKLLKIAQEHSPCFIYDKKEFTSAINRFQNAFGKEILNFEMYYAMKSNPHPYLLKEILKTGCGIDVSSGRELAIALNAGHTKILFSGPAKTKEELSLALKHPAKVTLNIDSLTELKKIKSLLKGNKKIDVGVRINTKYHGQWDKFGIPLVDLGATWKILEAEKNINPVGIQVHMSWNKTAQPYNNIIREIGVYLKNNKSILEKLNFLDLGGGFLTPELKGISLTEYAKKISLALRKYVNKKKLKIFFEPGRIISTYSMHLLLKIEDVKGSSAITDGGTNMIGWVDKEDPYPRIVNITNPAKKEIPMKIFGSLCTPEDIWAKKVFAKKIEIGDVLLIPFYGAYTYTYAQIFIKPFPTVVTF